MVKIKMINYRWISIGFVLISIFCSNVKSESGQEKDNIVCKQKVLWKMRMCSDGKLVCSKNKKYVEKAKHYIKALGSPNYTRKVKAYNKLMKIAHYILPYIKGEYKRVKKLEQKNALIGYRSLNILKDVQIKIMCEDGEGGFMWYAVILKGAVKTFAPWGFVSLGFILVGNESWVIEGIQVRGYTKYWRVSNYSCDLRDKSRTKFAIEINDGEYNYVVTENSYYKNSRIYPSRPKNFYIIVKSERDKVKAVIDGKESEEYNIIRLLTFSSSGSRYGFVAVKSNGKHVAVIDGKESKEYNDITEIAFSSSGDRYGFIAQKENGNWVVVIDGKESDEYRSVELRLIKFSSSGNRYGFVAQKENGKWVVVVDWKESEEYNSIGLLTFSSSGSRYGFVAVKENGKAVVVIDGKESKEYNGITDIAFSSSGDRYGFVAQKENGKWVAVIDGKESDEYNSISALSFSSSGDRYRFVAQKENGKHVAVVDGKESDEYNKIWTWAFSSSGNRHVFLAEKGNGKHVAVIDGKESDEYDHIGQIFSSFVSVFVFTARKKNGKWVAVIDGKESKEYNDIGLIAFSSSGSRYIFTAREESGQWVVVTDGEESKKYDNIEYTRGGWSVWSSDDKFFVFVGRIKRAGESEMCEVVVSNHPARTTNCTPDLYFHKNTLKFIEFRNNKIYSVSCKLE